MIWKLIGKYYGKKRNFKQAAKFLHKGRRSLTTVSEIGMLAESLHNIGQSDKSLSYLGDMIAKYPRSSHLHERRAHILREMHREEEAIADLDIAIKLNQGRYINWYTRGLAYKDLGKYEEAVRDLKESIAREGPSTVISTYFELAMAYFQSGQYEEAVDYFEKTIRTTRAIPSYFYMLSRSLEELDRTQEAIDILTEGVSMLDYYESMPDKGYAHFAQTTNYSFGAFKTFQRMLAPTYSFRGSLSQLYIRIGNYERAEETMNQAIRLYPGESELYLRRGDFFLDLKQWEQASADYGKVIQLDSSNMKGHYQLAKVYRQMDDEENAMHIFRRLYEQKVTPATCYWLADSYFRMGQTDEALSINKRLLEIEDDDALNYMQQGEILLKLNRYHEAEQAFGKAVELNDHAEARNRKSYALYLQDKYEDAIMELQESEANDAEAVKDPFHHLALGHNYKAMGEWEFAVMSYSKAIGLYLDNKICYEYRAECYLELKQFEAAIADCSKAISMSPDSFKLYQMRGYAYYCMEDYGLARKDVLTNIALEPKSPLGYYHLGMIDYAERDYEEALNHFKRTVELDRTHANSYIYQAYIYFNRYDIDDCAQCIVQWAMTRFAEMPLDYKRTAIESLEGFDETALTEALDKLNSMYGETAYLS